MSDLELRVSQAQTFFRALEMALHSPRNTRWSLEVGAERVPADRFRHEHGVRFEAPFEQVPEVGILSLVCEGSRVLSQPFDRPTDYAGLLSWDLAMEEDPALR